MNNGVIVSGLKQYGIAPVDAGSFELRLFRSGSGWKKCVRCNIKGSRIILSIIIIVVNEIIWYNHNRNRN